MNPLSADQSPAAAARYIYLDVLRGVAILLVLGRHAPFPLPDHTHATWFYEGWKRVGWAGVDLFFVLSGFLIGGLLLAEHRKHGQIRFARFFVRRLFKIWPTYLVFLAVGFIWDVVDVAPQDAGLSLAARMHQSLGAIWVFLVHIQNYKETEIHSVIGTAWSLAVEEHFYLILPLLLWGLGRLAQSSDKPNPYRALPWIGVGFAGVCLALRFQARRSHPEWNEFIHHLPTHLRIDSLFAGVTLAYLVQFARARIDSLRPYRWAILITSIALFAPFARTSYTTSYTSWQTTTFGYSILMLASMGLVLAAWFASQPPPPQPVRRRSALSRFGVATMAMIGSRSYSIYLFHVLLAVPIVMKLHTAAGVSSAPILMAAYLALSVLIGAIAYFFIEAPSVALRDWLIPSTSRREIPIARTEIQSRRRRIVRIPPPKEAGAPAAPESVETAVS